MSPTTQSGPPCRVGVRALAHLPGILALLLALPAVAAALAREEFQAHYKELQRLREGFVLAGDPKGAGETVALLERYLADSARKAASAHASASDDVARARVLELAGAISGALGKGKSLGILAPGKAAEIEALLPKAPKPGPPSGKAGPDEGVSAGKAPSGGDEDEDKREDRERLCRIDKLKRVISGQFKAYENGDVGGFMKHVSPNFTGYDRFGLGLGRSGLEKAISDDLQNLKGIQFDVNAEAPDANFRVPITWSIRGRMGTGGAEWTAINQRSVLRYSCAGGGKDSEGGGFLLEAIEGENVFGRSNFAGVTVVDKGSVDGQELTAPVGVVSGGFTRDASLMVGLAGVPGTPGSTSFQVVETSGTPPPPPGVPDGTSTWDQVLAETGAATQFTGSGGAYTCSGTVCGGSGGGTMDLVLDIDFGAKTYGSGGFTSLLTLTGSLSNSTPILATSYSAESGNAVIVLSAGNSSNPAFFGTTITLENSGGVVAKTASVSLAYSDGSDIATGSVTASRP